MPLIVTENCVGLITVTFEPKPTNVPAGVVRLVFIIDPIGDPFCKTTPAQEITAFKVVPCSIESGEILRISGHVAVSPKLYPVTGAVKLPVYEAWLPADIL